VKKPPRPEGSNIYYQVTYHEGCPLLLHLHLMAELPSQPVKRPSFVRVTEISGGPLFQGPVDIVMPVLSSKP
jgi:hypothetical protein